MASPTWMQNKTVNQYDALVNFLQPSHETNCFLTPECFSKQILSPIISYYLFLNILFRALPIPTPPSVKYDDYTLKLYNNCWRWQSNSNCAFKHIFCYYLYYKKSWRPHWDWVPLRLVRYLPIVTDKPCPLLACKLSKQTKETKEVSSSPLYRCNRGTGKLSDYAQF